MKKVTCILLALVVAGMILPMHRAEAEIEKEWNFYLIQDSNTRELTEEEIWRWDYDSLWYLINEIFARHGFVFKEGGQFYDYFNRQAWYEPNIDNEANRKAYDQTTDVEWHNEHIIKVVMEQMQEKGTKNDNGTRNWKKYLPVDSMPEGFAYANLGKRQSIDVYSAPDKSSWRGAEGKAYYDPSFVYWAAGWEGDWLLVMYPTNRGGFRIGYGKPDMDTGIQTQLEFAYTPCQLKEDAVMTDDPVETRSPVYSLTGGEIVTFLASFGCLGTDTKWAYVEAVEENVKARGFIPMESLLTFNVGQ